ncbi:MAG: acetate/propionate family kinase [Elusimicrobia bacterium]|nr:acetate/propionate family kinase [Candidatus Obscuribacterium magneticum]
MTKKITLSPKVPEYILTINGGSSSIKFALFQMGLPQRRCLSGKVERIGLRGSTMTACNLKTGLTKRSAVSAPHHASAIKPILNWLFEKIDFNRIRAVGHRVVHGGGRYSRPERVTASLLKELEAKSRFAPEHLPAELLLIRLFRKRYPRLPQVACFDTAFHQHMPRVAKIIPLPRRYDRRGIRRYGFHGLSYSYLMQELKRIGGPKEAMGRIILAHLGNGVSLAAARRGKGIDTTMAFTPTAGLPMSTRSGDLDPGIVTYLAKVEGMSVNQFYEMVNERSGLLGISETSSDMRDLLKRGKKDVRAAEAVSFFCYQVKKGIGAFTAALGGLDTLVFSGGIGENAHLIRWRICEGLRCFGIELDKARNNKNAALISPLRGRVKVRVIRTDEEAYIAESVWNLLAG